MNQRYEYHDFQDRHHRRQRREQRIEFWSGVLLIPLMYVLVVLIASLPD